jgi:uncharacterized membrane protein (DUF106 family)
MSIQGIVLLDVVASILLVWILDLTRRGQLYVGYGVIFVVTILGSMIVISVPMLLEIATSLLGALLPVSALTFMALGFIILMLVYILTQTTIISNRVAEVVQELAIQKMKEAARDHSEDSAQRSSEEDRRK